MISANCSVRFIVFVCLPNINLNFYTCQVQWDEPSSILRPERISPWEVEPLVAANPQSPQPPSRNKRARPPASPSMVAELPSGFGKESLNTCYKIGLYFLNKMLNVQFMDTLSILGYEYAVLLYNLSACSIHARTMEIPN